MPDSIVRIVCEQNTKFWTVQQGGAVRLGSESEAQLFVCHSEGDRSCFIQHLQSGAFVEQGDDRKLKLGTSPASASLFSRLRAYSEGIFTVVVQPLLQTCAQLTTSFPTAALLTVFLKILAYTWLQCHQQVERTV